MRWISAIVVAAAIGAAAPAHAQSIVSAAEFRDEVIALLRAQRPDLCIRIQDEWTLHFGPDESTCANSLAIENMYREYLSAPSRKADFQARLARTGVAMLAGPPDTSNLRSRVVVVLRPLEYANLFEDSTVVHRPFAGDMIAVLMLDSPETLIAMSPEALSEHGLSEQVAFDLAATNLKDRMGDVQVATEMGIEIIEAETGLATGILWLPESCGPQSEGDQALIFDRNGYLRAAGADGDAVRNFRMVAEGMIADNASLSRSIITCRVGSWVAADAL